MGIEVTVQDGVATVVINRPDRHNSLDAAAYRALGDAWVQVRDDPAIRCAVVTGAGTRAFCAGADLGDPATAATGTARLASTQQELLLNRGLEVWKPVVAAVNGYCLGGGLTLLLATDIRIAGTGSSFGVPEVTRGFLPGNGGTQRMIDAVGHARAMQLLLTGDPVDATTASDWGLVNEVVAVEQVLPQALRVARRIAAHAPLAVQATKELALRARTMTSSDGLRLEQWMLAALQGTEDAAEGLAAFEQRRPPVFRGR